MNPAAGTFIDKWLLAEPWHRLLLVFEPAPRRSFRELIESIGFELRSAALDSSDIRIATGKLAWWADEWRMLAEGRPRHPLTIALHERSDRAAEPSAGTAWIAAAALLAEDVSDADLDARCARWLPFAQAQAIASHGLGATDADARLHAGALLTERLTHLRPDLTHGRLPLPLAVLAKHRLDRGGLADADKTARSALADFAMELAAHLKSVDTDAQDGYRRGQAALARLRAHRLRRRPENAWQGHVSLPPLRAAFAAWRARRSNFISP